MNLAFKKYIKENRDMSKLHKIAVKYDINDNILEGVYNWCQETTSYEYIAKTLRKINTNKLDTVHEITISKNELFGDIDKMICYLKQLKENGFDAIEEEWSGYEDNYFVALKHHDIETDEEYYKRLAKEVDYIILNIKKKKKEEKKSLTRLLV